MKASRKVALCSAALASAAIVKIASANSISLQLWDNNSANYEITAQNPTVMAGEVPVQSNLWNVFGSANNTGGFTSTISLSTFTDNTGTTISSMTIAGGKSEVFTIPSPQSTPNGILLDNMFGTNSANALSVTLSGVPYSTYDLYVYDISNTAVSNALDSITDGTTTFYSYGEDYTLTSLVECSTSSGTTSPGNYSEFVESSSAPAVLSVTSSANQFAFTAFQIVDATPEPASTAALAVVGMFGLLRRRRRAGHSSGQGI